MSAQIVERLDDATVLRILSHASAELRDRLPADQQTRIGSIDDARESIHQLLDSSGVAHDAMTLDRLSNPAIARAVLARMLAEPQTRDVVEPLIMDPPRDQQKSAELALAGAVILGSLIAWLQTTIDISVGRGEDGKTQYSFKLRKEAASSDVVKDVAKQVGGLLVGKP